MESLRRAVVVGAGFGAQHVEWLATSGRARVCSLVYSNNEERAARLARERGIPHITRNTDVIAGPDVDLVVVVSPPSSHYPLVRRALEAGKQVVCDKPLALSHQQAVELAQLADCRRIRAMTFFQWRFFRPFRELRRLLREPGAGPLHFLYMEFVHDFLATNQTAWPWRHNRAQAGFGAFGDMGVHLIDLGAWLSGRRVVVEQAQTTVQHAQRASGDRLPIACETEDAGHALFRLEGAAAGGALYVSRCSAYGRSMRVIATTERAQFELRIDIDSLQCQWRTSAQRTFLQAGEFDNPYRLFLDGEEPRGDQGDNLGSALVDENAWPDLWDGANAQLALDSVSRSTGKATSPATELENMRSNDG